MTGFILATGDHSLESLHRDELLNKQRKIREQYIMKRRKYKKFVLRIMTLTLVITITASINNHNSLSAGTKSSKSVITKEKTPVITKKKSADKKNDTLKNTTEITPASADKDSTGTENGNDVTDKKSETPDTSVKITPVITEKDIPGVKNEKNTTDKKSDTSETPAEIKPVITDKETPGVRSENSAPVKNERTLIKAEELFDHPDIILNAYKEAYPGLITDVKKDDKDWTLKFANGNIYYWADGKILPESVLPKSDKYIRYSIYPYNVNGRSPELYTAEMIEKLRVKKQPPQKKKVFVPGEEGCLYKELFAITTKKSAKKQLCEVRLSGHYITVHHSIAAKIKLIDSKINALSKTDPEVRSYLKNIGSVEAFNWRKIAGTDRKSNHSFGIAIDILPKKYRKKILYWGWEQDKNNDWMLLPQSSLWTPPDQVVKIFLAEGFIWGGHWDKYDTMHFEYRPELICLSKNIIFDKPIVKVIPGN